MTVREDGTPLRAAHASRRFRGLPPAARTERRLEFVHPDVDEHTVVRARMEEHSLLTVTVKARDGDVLHRYAPEEFAVTEVEKP